jgi:PIN domain nuclease of toxin-antitoxin system
MKFLLDTHVLFWVSGRGERLWKEIRDIVDDPTNVFVFSVASIWETAIKYALKRVDFVTDPVLLRNTLLDTGYTELPIVGAHANAVANLPHIHRDPFDRILIAQAIIEGITLLTADPVLARYPAPVRLV